MAFLAADLHPTLDAFFKEQGYKTATAVQKKVIPEMLDRKSMIVLAETGSGKTLAYALPIVDKIKKREDKGIKNDTRCAPVALVISPTRELATQIHQVFKDISHHAKFRVRSLTGGTTISKVKTTASETYEVLVATPTRIRSALARNELSFNQLQMVIFDEADNLLEMGFKKDLDYVIEHFDMNMTQVGFFTATLPPLVEEYIQDQFPMITFEKAYFGSSHATQTRIDTFNVKVTPAEKNMVVKMFLEKEAKGRGIIFTNQKNQADELFKYLSEKMPKLKVRLIHGDLESKDRESAIKSFRDGKAQVLVATDIAARGIDVKDLVWVVNYGLPKTAIYYLHRCGRVARGGRHGIVYNLVASHDSKMISEINESIRNQKHLNLTVIPENKFKEKEAPAKKKVEQAKAAATPASFRGKSRGARSQPGTTAGSRNKGFNKKTSRKNFRK